MGQTDGHAFSAVAWQALRRMDGRRGRAQPSQNGTARHSKAQHNARHGPTPHRSVEPTSMMESHYSLKPSRASRRSMGGIDQSSSRVHPSCVESGMWCFSPATRLSPSHPSPAPPPPAQCSSVSDAAALQLPEARGLTGGLGPLSLLSQERASQGEASRKKE